MKSESFKKEEERLKKEIEKLERNFKSSVFSKDSRDYKEKVIEEVNHKIDKSHLDKHVNNNNFFNSNKNQKPEQTLPKLPEINKAPKNDYLIFNKQNSKKPVVNTTKNTFSNKFHKPFNKSSESLPVLNKVKTESSSKESLKNSSRPKFFGNYKKDIIPIKNSPGPKINPKSFPEKLVSEYVPKLESDNLKNVKMEINTKVSPVTQKSSNLPAVYGSPVILVSEKEIKSCAEDIKKLKTEMGKVVIGQHHVIDGLIRGLICDGHVLLEGIPGIAKTLTVRALGEATGCIVKRVQFTVDLLPTDIIGITSYTPEKGFEIIKGPVFTNFLIADEINRSPPKTQSALIEAMQEKIVTIGKEDFKLPSPFFVMATKNPIENIGVYTLPEAQIDRFLFNLIMEYPEESDERKIMEQNITTKRFEDYNLKPVINPDDIIKMQDYAKKIYLGEHIKTYILEIVKKTRDKNFRYAEYISNGASPRASIALFIASKARALMEGRNYVIPEDVRSVIFDILRHRLILSYRATVKKIKVEEVIQTIIDEVEVG